MWPTILFYVARQILFFMSMVFLKYMFILKSKRLNLGNNSQFFFLISNSNQPNNDHNEHLFCNQHPSIFLFLLGIEPMTFCFLLVRQACFFCCSAFFFLTSLTGATVTPTTSSWGINNIFFICGSKWDIYQMFFSVTLL